MTPMLPMIRVISLAASIGVLVASPIVARPAVSQTQAEHDAALAAMKRGEVMDYAKIRRRAETHLKGQLVGARLRQTGRGWIYEVRVRQANGAVVFAILDARTGQQIKR